MMPVEVFIIISLIVIVLLVLVLGGTILSIGRRVEKLESKYVEMFRVLHVIETRKGQQEK